MLAGACGETIEGQVSVIDEGWALEWVVGVPVSFWLEGTTWFSSFAEAWVEGELALIAVEPVSCDRCLCLYRSFRECNDRRWGSRSSGRGWGDSWFWGGEWNSGLGPFVSA